MSGRSEIADKVHELLIEHGRRIWDFSDYRERGSHGFWQTLDCYATRYGPLIFQRMYEDGVLIGWEVYSPVMDTNKAMDTYGALLRLLDGEKA